MKSEKAKEALENSAKHVSKYRPIQGCQPFDEFVLLKNAERAVEIAEQEAEERMRKRAAKAYCDECCWASGTACEREVAHCAFLRAFTKKLNGE